MFYNLPDNKSKFLIHNKKAEWKKQCRKIVYTHSLNQNNAVGFERVSSELMSYRTKLNPHSSWRRPSVVTCS